MQTLTVTQHASSYTDYNGRKAYWENEVATVKLTPRKLLAAGESFDVGPTYVQFLRVPRGVNARVLAAGLKDTMGGGNCHHSYDCCGCARRAVSVTLIAPRRMMVHTRVTYNY